MTEKEIQTTKTIFIAEDGREFEHKDTCQVYEMYLKVQKIKDMVKGTPIFVLLDKKTNKIFGAYSSAENCSKAFEMMSFALGKDISKRFVKYVTRLDSHIIDMSVSELQNQIKNYD